MKKLIGRRTWWAVSILVCSLFGDLTWMTRPAFSAWTVGDPMTSYFTGPGWGGIAQTNATAQQMATGGWNLVWAQSVSDLNVAQSHGLRAMWTGSLDDATVKSIRNYPALYAYFVKDEPSASEFAGLASTVSRLRGLDPNRLAYINLFPTYASSSQLGVSDYRTYLNQYISTVHPDLLSYDHYQFAVGSDTSDYFKNLAVVSQTAKQAGLPFMNIVQSCSWDASMRVPNGNELRYLYNTSLAYGAKGISDYVYYYPSFTGGMLSSNGTTTTLYDAAKTANHEFESIAKQVQSLLHIGAYHLGDLPPGFGTTDGSSPLRLPSDSPFKVSPNIADTNFRTNRPVRGVVMGLFGPNDDLEDATRAVVVNLDYSNSRSTPA